MSDAFWIALFAFLTAAVGAFFSWRNGQGIIAVRKDMNGLLQQRVLDAGRIGHAQGREVERAEHKGNAP